MPWNSGSYPRAKRRCSQPLRQLENVSNTESCIQVTLNSKKNTTDSTNKGNPSEPSTETINFTYQEEKALVQLIRRKRPQSCIVIPNEDEEAREEGALVWASWVSVVYPCIRVSGAKVHLRPAHPCKVWILWLADGKVSEILEDMVYPLDTIEVIKEVQGKLARKNSMLAKGVSLLWDEIKARFDKKLHWKKNKQQDLKMILSLPTEVHASGVIHCPAILVMLQALHEQHRESYKKLVKEELEDSSDSDSDSDVDTPKLPARAMNDDVRKLVSAVVRRERKLDSMCLACGSEENVATDHPVFGGRVCTDCSELLTEGIFAVANNGEFIFCTVCCRGGRLVVCGSRQCQRVFCETCLRLLVDDSVWTLVASLNQWLCYLCNRKQPAGILTVRNDWQKRIVDLLQPKSLPTELTSFPSKFQRRPIKILSLFDGIATGYIATDKAGLSIGKYHAFEIDPEAVKVTKRRHGNSITYHGDVRNITSQSLQRLLPINLLIGGSPCNELSVANPFRRGLQGGTGLLFYEYYRILTELQKLCLQRDQHIFWLYENVVSMRAEDKRQISRFFGREPVLVDAVDFGAQRRPRYFWGNLPGMYTEALELSSHWLEKRTLEECIESSAGRSARVPLVGTITTQHHSGRGHRGNLPVLQRNGELDTLWIVEVERLFGLPEGYTEGCGLTLTSRRRVLGKAWSVPVIANLLRPLKQLFLCKDEAVENDIAPDENVPNK